jgi:hypothetical protein
MSRYIGEDTRKMDMRLKPCNFLGGKQGSQSKNVQKGGCEVLEV